jgi:hypothetical protein
VTQFFLAGVESDSEGAEAAYSELRECSQIAVGCAASRDESSSWTVGSKGATARSRWGDPCPTAATW